jgi:hypothetical protein
MSVRCQQRKWPRSFDHLISAGQQRRRDFETEFLGGLEIDNQLVCRGLRANISQRSRRVRFVPAISGHRAILAGLRLEDTR